MYYFNEILKLEPVTSSKRQFHWGIWEMWLSFWSQPFVHNSANRPIFMKITGLEGEKSPWPVSISNSYLLLKADEWVSQRSFFSESPMWSLSCHMREETETNSAGSHQRVCSSSGLRMLLQSPHLWPTLSYLTTAKQVTRSSRWSLWHSEVCVSYTHHATGKTHIRNIRM